MSRNLQKPNVKKYFGQFLDRERPWEHQPFLAYHSYYYCCVLSFYVHFKPHIKLTLFKFTNIYSFHCFTFLPTFPHSYLESFSFYLKNPLVYILVQILVMANSACLAQNVFFFLSFWRYKILDRHFEGIIPLSSGFHFSYQSFTECPWI